MTMDNKTGSAVLNHVKKGDEKTKVSKAPKPEKIKQQLIKYHIMNENIPKHMAINAGIYSPVLCGGTMNNSIKSQGETKDMILNQYRLIRDQNAQLNRFADVQSQVGWEYGIPMVIVHPEQLDDFCPVCYELAKDMTILLISLTDAETLFHLDVSKAWSAWEVMKKSGKVPGGTQDARSTS